MTAMMGDLLKPVVWWRDYLPNHLWLCWQVSSGEYVDVFMASKLLDEISTGLGEDRTGFPKDWELAGRLSDFEAIPVVARERVLTHLEEVGAYSVVVPEELAHALGMFTGAPGRWLIQPWLDSGLSIDPSIAERELGRVVGQSMDGRGDIASRAKALFFRQKLIAGRIKFSREGLSPKTEEAIKGYPKQNTPEQNVLLESHVRAMFLLLENEPKEWCKLFWRSNWSLFPCRAPGTELHSDAIDIASDEAKSEIGALRLRAESIWGEFVQLTKTTDPDLYSPDRFEVLTGIVARALRLVRLFAKYPPMWTMEHGAPVLRALVETRIVMRYLEHKSDATLYAKFKSYGIGRLKLYKLHLEQFIDEADEVGEGIQAHLDLVSAYVNRDTMEEYIDIDLGGNFAGSDMRKMADEVDLGTDYRLLFARASSNVHGEWGALDMNVFQTCLNPLHGGHRVLLEENRMVIGPRFIDDVLDYSAALLSEHQHFLGAKEAQTEPT